MSVGKRKHIMHNLIAEGKAEPMIVVMEYLPMQRNTTRTVSPGTHHEWLTWRRCFKEFVPHLFKW